ncbi:GtrA family protein [Streptomyces qinzhouensis]|uniref:GtrA family protein n=1 Tax=Streptomyces qinzhouensis TaxID=2599401 RepID=A0A5B8J9H1_9ACTN|nr:GtrA family protein [Streptomyces qinzhouensis]QDY77044.1 GtrA family protein [Streptomyces qinzhouensis]
MGERGGALRGQLHQLVREVAKFGAVGGVGVLVNLAVFNLVRQTTEIPVVRASIIATVVAIAFNYVGFRYFTYRDRDKTGRTRELSLFLLFSVIGLVIENGILYAATYGFDWDSPLQSNFFKFFGIGVATMFRFWSYRTWVFRHQPEQPEAVAAGESPTGVETVLPTPPGVRSAAPGRSSADQLAPPRR